VPGLPADAGRMLVDALWATLPRVRNFAHGADAAARVLDIGEVLPKYSALRRWRKTVKNL
jgi:hypothetical protein